MLGVEAVYCELNKLWYGGGNIHRTPFGGRNMQYYSEDGVMGCYVGWYEAERMQELGIMYGIKHFALNDQEANRESLATFANEQSPSVRSICAPLRAPCAKAVLWAL